MNDMIAYFNSYNSGHHYFATDEQAIRGKTNIYVVDPKGAEQVHDFYKNTNIEVITIGIYDDRDKLVDNVIERSGVLSGGITFDEFFRNVSHRIIRDEELFKIIKCDYMIKGSSNALEFIKNELLHDLQ